MYNIYKITNLVNGKLYIGKTHRDINFRFSQHQNDSKKQHRECRPLYNAMNKYGLENFKIELIEQTNNDCEASDRETYWIQYFRTYIGFPDCNGYNATLGGDGKQRINHNLILETFQETKSGKETAEKLNVCPDTVYKILKSNGIESLDKRDAAKKVQAKKIVMINKDRGIVMVFESVSDAALFITKAQNKRNYEDVIPHIIHVCQGKRKTAYGYRWEYIDGEGEN